MAYPRPSFRQPAARPGKSWVGLFLLCLALPLTLFAGAVRAADDEIVSLSSTNQPVRSDTPAVNGDGRFVVFYSVVNGVTPDDTNDGGDFFVRDRSSGTTERVSTNTTASETGERRNGGCAISADGRIVAFSFRASTQFRYSRLYLRDRVTGELLSLYESRAGGKLTAEGPVVSDDGRFVAFLAGTGMGLYDQEAGATEVLEHGGTPHSISPDNRYIYFYSSSGDLVDPPLPPAPAGNPYLYERDRLLRRNLLATEVRGHPVSVSANRRFRVYTQANAFYSYLEDLNITLAPPTDLTAVSPSPTIVDLRWTDIATRERNYRLLRRTGLSGPYQLLREFGANVQSYRDQEVAANTAYSYKLVVRLEPGVERESSPVSVTTGVLSPPAPTNARGQLLTPNSVFLAWDDNSAGPNSEDGFRVYRWSQNDPVYRLVTTLPRDETRYRVYNLPANTRFIYYVVAFNAAGVSTSSNKVSLTTGP